ncbi:probable polygalacturonase [Bradysia coprophila]|uniref:probable polygalacturonase n=1 Tax=Bradysia coprophila TaxID=38358 RepID=UPI00187D91EC|nr:probable polygalacturonase [Bradysia coprophila]
MALLQWLSMLLLLIISMVSYSSSQIDPWDRVPIILNRIKAPIFPARTCDVTSYGAIRSGSNDVEAPSNVVDMNAKAFEDAINDCNILGGGTVYVPSGTFITSAITLKSNISLHISAEAVVRFTKEISRYPTVFTRWEGIELMNYSPLIYAFEVENIAITGSGLLDGNADCNTWWNWRNYCANSTANQNADRDTLFKMAENNVTVSERIFGLGHYLRAQFIQPYRSKNVLIEGVTVVNSPMWIIHPVLCENVIIRNINLTSLGPNNDGIDPESCTDVWITGVLFNSGDDDIAIKSGRNADGRRINVPSQNFVIQNCTMLDGHGGITLGSEISGGVKNVFVEDCYLDSPRLDTAIRVKNNAMRGGTLEDFYVRNVRVGQVAKQVIEVDFYYDEGSNGGYRPVLRDYIIENVNVLNGAPYSLFIRGFPDHPRTSYIGITLRNISFTGLRNSPHYVLEEVDYISANDITVDGKSWNVQSSSSAKFVNFKMLFCKASLVQILTIVVRIRL